MQNKVFSYLNRVLIWSFPFYFLNIFIPQTLFFNLPASFLMIIVPFIVAGITIFRENGREGIRSWLASAWDFDKLKKGALLASFLTMPIIFTLVYLQKNGLNGLIHIFSSPNNSLLSMIMTFILFYIGAVIEELGWTTYATPRLQKHVRVLKAGLIIGTYWGLWHVIPYFHQGYNWQEIIVLVLSSIGFRVIMG